MRDSIVARNYAATLFELAGKHDAVEAYGELIEEVARVVDETPAFRRFLETPKIDAEEKKALLRNAYEDRVPKPFLHFLLITIDKRRQRVLREIAAAYHDLLDEHLGRTHVEVTLAREPDDGTREALGRRLTEYLGKTAVTHVRIRPEILGGIILRTGDRIYDGSLRRRLEGLRERLVRPGRPAGAAG